MFFAFHFAKAGTPQGAFISYKYIDSLKYEVKLHYYRSCLDSSLTNAVNVYVRCLNGSDSVKLKMQWQSIKDNTPTCTKEKKRCDPANTSNTGEGFEEHVFTAIVDFADTTFKAVSTCDAVIFFFDECCRSTAFTTGSFIGNLYNYAYLNRKLAEGNSSPQMTLPPIFELCTNQSISYNLGIIDSFDFDSVSYKLDPPLGSKWPTYNNPYSYNRFVSAYWPSPLKHPYANCNAEPPIGICFDPETGDITFTPTKNDEITLMVMKIEEWRKDITGKYQLIGVVRMDQMFYVSTCPLNNSPQVTNSSFVYRTCERERICFNVTTDDKTYYPPAPLPKPPPDTVLLSWSHGIPGAEVQITNKGALHETARFCWTPAKGTASDLPYVFYAEARDNACPLTAITRHSFRIFVKHKAEAEMKITKHSCGYYVAESKPIPAFRGAPQYSWQILDEKMAIVLDSRVAYFNSTGYFLSKRSQDTIYFRKAGTYIIQHTINNLPNNCPTTYFETIVVADNITDLVPLEDTFYCKNQPLALSADLAKIKNFSLPTWHTGNPADTGTIAAIYFNQTLDSFILKFTVQDSMGCEVADFLKIRKWDVAKPDLGKDTILCGAYLYKLKAPVQEKHNWFKLDYNWQDVSKADSFIAAKSGIYWVEVSNNCGSIVDTMTIFDKTNLLKPTLPIHFCQTDSVTINPQLKDLRYLWQNAASDTNYQIQVKQAGIYLCNVIMKCGDTLTEEIAVISEKVPEVQLDDTAEFCEGQTLKLVGGKFDAFTSILWNDNSTDSINIIDMPGFYWLRATNLCGQFFDTIRVTERKLPRSHLGNDTLYCNAFNRSYNFPQRNDGFLWSDKSTTPYFSVNQPGKYWLTASNYCGVSSDTIVIDQLFPPQLNLGNDTSTTAPFDIVLDAQNAGSKYLWNTSDTTRIIVVKTFGKYWVSVSNDCGSVSDTIEILEKLGVEDLTSDRISIYPNPGNGKIIVSFDRFDDSTKMATFGFQVFDMNGKLVPIKYKMLSGGFEIELEQATSGTYLLRWPNGEKLLNKVFVVD
jgi:hypothetical protein